MRTASVPSARCCADRCHCIDSSAPCAAKNIRLRCFCQHIVKGLQVSGEKSAAGATSFHLNTDSLISGLDLTTHDGVTRLCPAFVSRNSRGVISSCFLQTRSDFLKPDFFAALNSPPAAGGPPHPSDQTAARVSRGAPGNQEE